MHLDVKSIQPKRVFAAFVHKKKKVFFLIRLQGASAGRYEEQNASV